MATGLSLGLFILLLFLLSLGIWVAPALIAIGYILLEFFTPAPVGSLLASTIWDASWNWALTALPLFIWMGEILFRTRLSSDMFKGLSPMLSRLPGGLLHVNVADKVHLFGIRFFFYIMKILAPKGLLIFIDAEEGHAR